MTRRLARSRASQKKARSVTPGRGGWADRTGGLSRGDTREEIGRVERLGGGRTARRLPDLSLCDPCARLTTSNIEDLDAGGAALDCEVARRAVAGFNRARTRLPCGQVGRGLERRGRARPAARGGFRRGRTREQGGADGALASPCRRASPSSGQKKPARPDPGERVGSTAERADLVRRHETRDRQRRTVGGGTDRPTLPGSPLCDRRAREPPNEVARLPDVVRRPHCEPAR